jgi:hypothetical protein
MDLVVIKNNTQDDITIGNFTFVPGEDFIMFDSSTESTYTQSFEILFFHFDLYKNGSLSGDLSVTIDGAEFSSPAQWEFLQDSVSPAKLVHKCGFSDHHVFFFNFRTKSFCVNDPISGDTWCSQMVKTEEPT